MLLYSFKITPNNRKVEAFIAHFDLPVEIRQIDFKHREHFSDEYIAINPMSKVPALVDGELERNPTWTQSIAVGQREYLEKIAHKLKISHPGREIKREDDCLFLRDESGPYHC